MKRRNQATQRELSRELASCKRRLQQMDQESGAREVTPSSLGSRTSSCSSIHEAGASPQGAIAGHLQPTSPLPRQVPTSPQPRPTTTSPQLLHVNGGEVHQPPPPVVRLESSDSEGVAAAAMGAAMMPDTQTLVEKIVKLQRACAKRQVGW